MFEWSRRRDIPKIVGGVGLVGPPAKSARQGRNFHRFIDSESFWAASFRRANKPVTWETLPMKLRRRRRRRYIDKSKRWQTVLVIGLCILAVVAVACGLLYDKARWG